VALVGVRNLDSGEKKRLKETGLRAMFGFPFPPTAI